MCFHPLPTQWPKPGFPAPDAAWLGSFFYAKPQTYNINVGLMNYNEVFQTMLTVKPIIIIIIFIIEQKHDSIVTFSLIESLIKM